MNKEVFIVKQNLTKKNIDKILPVIQKNINLNDNILIVKNENENFDKNLFKEYIEKNFVSNLQQFLKQKGYELTKSPIIKTKFKTNLETDNNNYDLENEYLNFSFLNFMEINGNKSFLSPEIVKEFENYLIEKFNLLFDNKFNQISECRFEKWVNDYHEEEIKETSSLSM